jgi:hypothetical protein
MRKSGFFYFYFAVLFVLVGLMFTHAHFRQKADWPQLQEKREMVRRFDLTDLCLFTDARYTRHPSMADFNTPFQDYPLSFEHFPSGTLIPPPPHLREDRKQKPVPSGVEGAEK